MKKILVLVLALVVCTSLFCMITYADSVDYTYTQIASNDFETNNKYNTHYSTTSSGGTYSVSTDYSHSGTKSIKRGVTIKDAGLKAVGILDDILKSENVGKKYRISAYVYTPDTTNTSYKFTISTVEATGWTLRHYVDKSTIAPNKWTEISMIIELPQSYIDNKTNSVRVCQRNASGSETYATSFYLDDVTIEEVTETKTVNESGFTTYYSTNCNDTAFSTAFTSYSDNYNTSLGFKAGGGLNAANVSVGTYYDTTEGNAIIMKNRAKNYHRIKVSGMLPEFTSDDIGKIVRVSAYFSAGEITNEDIECKSYLSIMTDGSTTPLFVSQGKLELDKPNYTEIKFVVTETFLSSLNGYPARIGFESNCTSGTAENPDSLVKTLIVDNIKVEIASTTIVANSYFTDNAVFQRNKPINVYGTGSVDGEKVEVIFDGTTKEATVKDGQWMVTFDAKEAKKGLNMQIKNGSYVKHLNNVAIGELWFTSGQSNMQFRMYDLKEDELNTYLENCENYDVRFIDQSQPTKSDLENPHIDVNAAKWYVSKPEDVRNMSALGYMMAYQIENDLDVTVGLVDVALGGSKIETWLSRETLQSRSEYASKVAELDNKIASDEYINSTIAASDYKLIPNALYNSMYSPFRYINARGMIWYQGESNSSTSTNPYYDLMLEDLINQYRKDQNDPDFHVVAVILAPYQTPNDFPLIRQNTFDLSKRINNMYPISTSNEGPDEYDYSISNSIHPSNKTPVGNRIYLAVKANVYDELNFNGTWNGPMYKAMTVNGNRAVLTFDQIGTGLKTIDGGALKGFTISADGTNFVDATATVVGNTIEVYADSVSVPKEVRYCYIAISDDEETLGGNLTNETNIPAIPFRASLADYDGAKSASENTVTYTVTNEGYSAGNIDLIFALYDEHGVLKDAKVKNVDVTTVGSFKAEQEFKVIDAKDVVKVFAFKDISTLIPALSSK